MTVKERFLQIETCTEFYKMRGEFKDLDTTDPEVIEHFSEITPTINSRVIDGEIVEVYKEKRNGKT